MRQYEIDMCNGSLWRKIFRFSVPLMFSNVLQVIFNISDVAVVGKFAGAIALGAVGSTSILVTLFTGIFQGLGGGVNVVTALHIGAGHEKAVRETVHTAAILCFLVGMFVTVAGIITSFPVLNALNTKPELIEDAVLYLRLYLLGTPALAMYNCGSAVLSAAGDTKRPLYYLFFSGIINVLLNLFLVIVCDMGVAGVAVASVIAQYISAILVLRLLLTIKENYQLRMKELHLTKDKALHILRLGIPTACQYSLFAVANLFVQVSVNSFDHVIVEGNSAATNADGIVYDMMAAFYTACASFIAQNFGAGNRKRVLKSYLISLLYSLLVGFGLGLMLFTWRVPFLSLFTNDKAVIEAGMMRISIMALSYGVSAFMDCTTAASRALGKSVLPTLGVVMGSVVFRIIWIYTVFAHYHTIQSLYLLYVISWVITALFEIVYFIHTYRKINFIGDIS